MLVDRDNEWWFRALFALPAERAIGAAVFALERNLPLQRAHQPAIAWPVEMLADPAAWVAAHELSLPDDPDGGSADTSFRHGLHALAVAVMHREDAARRTAACVVAIRSARAAFETHVWAADDPEAFAAWHDGDLQRAKRTRGDNAAVRAVREREWRAVVDWLAQPAADPAGAAELEAAIVRWRAREHDLL